MDDPFAWVKLIHVMAATIWFGGTIYVEALMAGAARTKDPQVMGTVSFRVGKTNTRLFPIVAMITVVFGSWLVIDNDLGIQWSDAFVSVGLLVWLVGLGMGIFFFMPQMKKIEAILASDGPGSPELQAIGKRISMAAHFMSLILTIAMIFMVVQP